MVNQPSEFGFVDVKMFPQTGKAQIFFGTPVNELSVQPDFIGSQFFPAIHTKRHDIIP